MATLYILSGIPGSGKTTYAEKHLSHAVYIGSDAIRKEFYGKEMTLRGYWMIHRLMIERADSHLRAGRDVVVDSVHGFREARRQYLRILPPGAKAVVVYMDIPVSVALSNNRKRKRHVPAAGILFLNALITRPTLDEGFDQIILVRDYSGSEIIVHRRGSQ